MPRVGDDPVMTEHADIEFFWDPICPYAWQTSRWIRRVAQVRGLTLLLYTSDAADDTQ